jgi:hypothetical protein
VTRIRMKIGISGITSVGGGKTYTDLKRGQIIDADENVANQYIEHGYAEKRLEGDVGPAYKSESAAHW